jgi:hypothetical protein
MMNNNKLAKQKEKAKAVTLSGDSEPGFKASLVAKKREINNI